MSRRTSKQAAFSLFSFQDIITSVTGIMILVTLLLAIELLQRKRNASPAQTEKHVVVIHTSIEEIQAEIRQLKEQLASAEQDLQNLPTLDHAALVQTSNDLRDDSKRLQQDLDALNKDQGVKQQQLAKMQQDDANDGKAEQQRREDLQKKIDDLKKQLAEINRNNRVFFSDGIKGKATWIVEATSGRLSAALIGVRAPPKTFTVNGAFEHWIKTLPKASTGFYLIVKPNGVPQFEVARDAIQKQGFEFGFDLFPSTRAVIDPQHGVGGP